MRCLDLFSGIGGFALGLESVGMHTIGFCEIEPFPRAVLAHHWPGVPIHDDVRTLSAESIPWLRAEAARGIDLICGGFPCQDISVAGKGAGLSGARSGLWSECSRLVGELRPRWALFENVGALKQRGIDRVCADLEGHGYTVWPLLVGAGVGVGAPHRRDRIWIVGRLADAEHLDGRSDEPGRRPEGGTAARRAGESRVAGSDAGGGGAEGRDASHEGRRAPARGAAVSERRGTPVGDAGASSGDRAADSAVGLADRYEQGQRGERSGGLLDGERAASGHDADGRGERPVGSPTGSGLEGQRADAGRAEVTQPWHTGALRWPARPGEPQHEWEEPRLAEFGQHITDRWQAWLRRGGWKPEEADDSGRAQQSLGGELDELSARLVRLARQANREALKAYGNSVVPAVVALIGQAILKADEALR